MTTDAGTPGAVRVLSRNALSWLLVVCTALALAGCQPQTAPAEKPAAAKAPRTHLVEIDQVIQDTLRLTNIYSGSLRYRRSVRIFTQEQGRLTRLPHFEGDRVAAGERLLELDDKLLRAELDKAEANARQAAANLRRIERLRDQRAVSEEEFLRAQTALEVAEAEKTVLQTRLGYTRVQAPFDGLVTARLAEPGDILVQHNHVLTLVDPESVVIDIDVSELVMPHLKIGQPVQVRIDALGDRQFTGQVLRIHPELDARTRQGRVEIGLKPVPAGARAGQFARVTFSVDALDRKVLPFTAVRRDRNGEYVFRLDAERKVHRIEVRSGRRLADRIEIMDGLQAGDAVVTKGFLGLREGMQVTPVETDKPATGEG